MPAITIYTTKVCPFCVSAKRLLARKGAEFNEIDVGADPEQRETMLERAGGRRTVPQIFIGDHHVGGCDDLYALEKQGKLDALIGK